MLAPSEKVLNQHAQYQLVQKAKVKIAIVNENRWKWNDWLDVLCWWMRYFTSDPELGGVGIPSPLEPSGDGESCWNLKKQNEIDAENVPQRMLFAFWKTIFSTLRTFEIPREIKVCTPFSFLLKSPIFVIPIRWKTGLWQNDRLTCDDTKKWNSKCKKVTTYIQLATTAADVQCKFVKTFEILSD